MDSQLWLDARRADALGLTPTATLSSAFVTKGDLSRGLSELRLPGPAAGGSGGGVQGAGGGDAPSAGETPLEVAWAVLPGVGGPSTAVPEGDADWYRRAQERHGAAIRDAWEEDGYESTHVEPIEEPRIRYVFARGPTNLYNEMGREYNEGSNVYLSNRSTARIFDHVVLTADPELSFLQTARPGDDDSLTQCTFRELSASVRLWIADLEVGRMPMWWGPGRNGTLLLSTNAQPLDAVRVSTPGPVLLPGFLGYLGLIRAETFLSRLHDDRDISRPYLWGMRLSTRILPWLELGAQRTAMFGGEGRPVTWETFWHVLIADTENDPDDPGDQRAALDARIVIPWSVQPIELYGEYGGEDEAGFWFYKNAYLGGVYLPRIGPWHALELTVEFADTAVPGEPGIWYRNGNYPVDGYRYEGRTIGHHVGTDGLDLFAELRVHPFDDDSTVVLSYNYEERFRLDPVVERLHQLRLGVEQRVLDGLRVTAFFEQYIWRNLGQVLGAEEAGQAIGVGAFWRF